MPVEDELDPDASTQSVWMVDEFLGKRRTRGIVLMEHPLTTKMTVLP